jgi:acyl carrier protein
MYRENAERERYRKQSFSLKDFVKGLGLRVEIAEMSAAQLARVSQLTFRTNQFNLTTIRRSEREIESFLMRGNAHCLVVTAADRFGDYGLVGVVLYEAEADRCKVDTLLLSCRVLGRGVEHALVARLGQQAVDEGKAFVEFAYRATARNAPAFAFISSIGGEVRNADATSWVFLADRLARVEYDPDEDRPIDDHPTGAHPESPGRRPRWALDSADRSDRLQRIAEELYDIERLAKAIDEFRAGAQAPEADGSAIPRDGVERTLVDIWKKVLGRPRIGMNDNFFDVGGTSLRAVQVIAAIKKELRQSLSIASLFECPTVTLLAAKLGARSVAGAGTDTIVAAAERGRQRRYHKTRRRSAS